MKQLLLVLALMGLSIGARAQDDPGTGAERARLKSERASVEAAFKAEEKACYGKFAVTDCLNAAKTRRRVALADLQRQEISLNDAERRRKAAQRVRTTEERAAAEREREETQRAKAAAGHKQRAQQAADKAAGRSSEDAARPGKAAQRQEQLEKRRTEQDAAHERKVAQEAENRARYERRMAVAEERRAKLEKKVAERKKPAASALPAPP
jgi:colicin import membrane protein